MRNGAAGNLQFGTKVTRFTPVSRSDLASACLQVTYFLNFNFWDKSFPVNRTIRWASEARRSFFITGTYAKVIKAKPSGGYSQKPPIPISR